MGIEDKALEIMQGGLTPGNVFQLLLLIIAIGFGIWVIGKVRRYLAHRRVVADERIAVGTVVCFDNNNGVVKGIIRQIAPGRIVVQTGPNTWTSVAPAVFMNNFTIEVPEVHWVEGGTPQVSQITVNQAPND